MVVPSIVEFCKYSAGIKVPVGVPNGGGTEKVSRVFDRFTQELSNIDGEILQYVLVETHWTHISIIKWWHPYVGGGYPKNQIKAVTASIRVTDVFIKQFFTLYVNPSCLECNIEQPDTPQLLQELTCTDDARFVKDLNDPNLNAIMAKIRHGHKCHMFDVSIANIIASGVAP